MNAEKIEKYQKIITASRPIEKPLLSQLRRYYRIGLTWSSNALERNGLTESETKVILEDGLTVGGKPNRDTYEAIGHSRAYDYMFSLIHRRSVMEEASSSFIGCFTAI